MDDNDVATETEVSRHYQTQCHAGYSGNFCDTCGSVRMIRAGTCEVCSECGTTTGCS